jgi:3-(methylthio)propionyl---CoA ligase
MPTQPTPPLLGQMMHQPLLISNILVQADRHFGSREIVSRRVEGDIHRYTYRDCHKRARQLANALATLGVRPGDRVATLAWNGYRHLEAYYAVSGSGAVLHTINPRLFAQQIVYIANHAEDQLLLFDLSFLPLVESIAAECASVKNFVLLAGREHMPARSAIPNLLCYEELIAAASDDYEWPSFDENAASGLCYTSGTTGHPKGALYSHRSTLLHAYASAMPDALGLSSRDVVAPVVPMFHVNAWGTPYSAPLTGAKLVLAGPVTDGAALHALYEREQVSVSAGVPTVWLGLLEHLRRHDATLPALKRIVIGGSACPPAMIDAFRAQGIDVVHSWGMTELSPLGTACRLQDRHRTLPASAQDAVLAKQGHALTGVDLKIVGEDGRELAWDGQTHGHLMARGPCVIKGYFKNEGGDVLRDGWFATGDVATIDADGYMQITDRSKDVIKSGGEWIGSIDLENIAMAHPAVDQAACIGVFHPKWDERPLLVVVRRAGAALTGAQLLDFFDGKVAKWWTPDEVAFVDALPVGPTGKVMKNLLREQFRGHRLAMA